jgi:NAD(P)-dependent dehydrogenase (short-subunit alcohol dehydrogenase family)
VHLEPFGILVNAIAPGYTGTGEPMSEEERAAYDAAHPLGIVGPEPVAGPASTSSDPVAIG